MTKGIRYLNEWTKFWGLKLTLHFYCIRYDLPLNYTNKSIPYFTETILCVHYKHQPPFVVQGSNNYILIPNLMHWLLFIHKILYSSTCFEPQVLIFRRIQLYTCSIWYCHILWWPVGAQLCTDRPPRTVTVPYAACIQLYPPEDEHLRLETCTGE